LSNPPDIPVPKVVIEGGDANDNFDFFGDLEARKEGSGRSLTAPGPSAMGLDSAEVMGPPAGAIPNFAGGNYQGQWSQTYQSSYTKKSSWSSTMQYQGQGGGGGGGGSWNGGAGGMSGSAGGAGGGGWGGAGGSASANSAANANAGGNKRS